MNVTEMDVAEWPLYSRGRSRYITNCLLTILHVKIGGGVSGQLNKSSPKSFLT